MTARQAALQALLECEKRDAWADVCLKRILREGGLDPREAALATRLTFGVIQERTLLDWYVDRFARGRLEPAVRDILRLGAYQILFLSRIPARAAVDESVKLARSCCKNPRAGGLVNAVLRRLEREKGSLSAPEDLSVRYSHPRWLVDALGRRVGEGELPALLACHNGEVPTAVQVNICRVTASQLLRELQDAGVQAQPHPWLADCLSLRGTGDLERLESFRGGGFYVQDAAARLAVLAAGPAPGERVLDVCAAPGGKSFAAAIAMGGRGEVVSCDIHPRKRALIEDGARRLGLSCIRALTRDGKERVPEWEGAFDLVLADVPCSGLGIIRKKPDIRWRDPAPLAGLPAVQRAILDNACAYVRPGGVLLYSTCTLLERENEDVVRAFLRDHREFAPEPFALPGPVGRADQGHVTLWPHRHGTDGFFIAKLRRRP